MSIFFILTCINLHLLIIVHEIIAKNECNELLPIVERVFSRRRRWIIFPKKSALKFTLNFGKKLFALYPKGLTLNIEMSTYYSLPSERPHHSYTIKYPNNVQSDVRNVWNYQPFNSQKSPLNSYHHFIHMNKKYKDDWDAFKYHYDIGNDYFKRNSNLNYIQYYKQRERRQLFKHFEAFSNSFGVNGKACILRILCESKRLLLPEGYSLIHDIVRTIFSISLKDSFIDEYQEAYNMDYEHCLGKVQANCPFNIPNIFLNKVYNSK